MSVTIIPKMVEEKTIAGAKGIKANWGKIFEAGKGKFLNKGLEKAGKDVLEEIP